MTSDRTEAEVHEALSALGERIRAVLILGTPVYVRYEPGNGTGYDLLFTPAWEVLLMPAGPLADRALFPPEPLEAKMVYLSRLSDGGASAYPWNWDHAPHPAYVAEKWMNDRIVDGCAITLLLAAISGTEPHCTLADAHIFTTDGARP